ncbi:hypothetical protein [Intestinibacter sp.]
MPYLELYSVRDGVVPEKSGLNWCFANANVCNADAYIALTVNFFRNNPNFFTAQGSRIITLWDDGARIECLLEATQTIGNQIYPKQISSYNDKSILGEYLRRRLNVSNTHVITMDDLDDYGRRDVEVSRNYDGTYYFDFSV